MNTYATDDGKIKTCYAGYLMPPRGSGPLANDGGETQCDITLKHIVCFFFCLKSVSKLAFVLSSVNTETHSDIYLKSNLAQVLGGYQVLMEFCVTSLMKEPMQGLRG